MHRLVFLLVMLPHAITIPAVTASAGGCSRWCNGTAVPYPFGFSGDCPILMACDAAASTPLLPGSTPSAAAAYPVHSFNSTASTFLANLVPSCNRSVPSAKVALAGAGYSVSSHTGLFLRGDCRRAPATESNSSCVVPAGIMTRLFRTAQCAGAGGANDTSWTCVVSSPPPPNSAAAGRGQGQFMDWGRVDDAGCEDALTAAVYGDTWDVLATMAFGVAELGWWLNGTCAGHGQCAANATCHDVVTPGGGQGHRCACLDGMDGDGFAAGEGCRYGAPSAKPKKNIPLMVAVGTSGLFGVCIILVTSLLCYKRYYGTMLPWQKGSTNAPRIESFLQKQGTSHPKRYTYSEVRRMTKSFTHKLGQGGYGAVYRGNLPDGCEVAVKMLKDTEGDGEEFMNEVASISRTSHVNVVTLLGFSIQGSKRALLYEYMPNGSLERYTFGSSSAEGEKTLSWDRLLDIVIGIARGLEYLHNGCNTRIVHFDIKPQNILLDQGYCPKISDFGLAKLCRQKESKVSLIGARGTIGYIAPEVFSRNYGAVSSKSDVYSYGMVILEMVGARKQIDVNKDSSSMYFPQWLYENLDQFCSGTSTGEIISSNTTELVRKMTLVGLWCIQFSPVDRPSMSRVLEMLESKAMDLELPPKAF